MLNVSAARAFRASMAVVTIVLGSVGNVLSLLVMQRPAMRNTSTAVYLSALAVADTLTLYAGQVPLLVDYFHDINLAQLSEGTCKLEWFLVFTLGDAAVWLLLSLTVDRFIAVLFATKAKAFCTRRRAVIVSVAVFALATFKNLHLLITRGLVVPENDANSTTTATMIEQVTQTPTDTATIKLTCGISMESANQFETYIRPWIGFSLYAFIPITAMLILNTLIAVTLVKMKRVREKRVHPATNVDGDGTKRTAAKGMSSQITSLTVMFLSVSIMFLVLITPSICNIVALPYWVDTKEDWDLFTVIASVTDSLVYINHSVNFLLYCISGRRFRAEFRTMIGCNNKTHVTEITVVHTVS